MRHHVGIGPGLAAAAVLWFGGVVCAEAELPAVVPVDAMAAVYWAGMDAGNGAEGYGESKLAAMLADTDLPGRIDRAVTASLREQAEWDDEAATALQVWQDLSPVVWRRPWAFWFSGLEKADGDTWDDMTPKIGFVIEPGDDAAAVGKWMLLLHQQITNEADVAGPFDLSLIDDGRRLGLLLNTDLAAPDAEARLITEADFVAATDGLSVEPAAWVYSDLAAIRGFFSDILEAEQERMASRGQAMPTAMLGLFGVGPVAGPLGLDGLDAFAWSAGFNDGDWEQSLFIAAPAPRAGVLTLMDQLAVDESQLAGVPRTVTWLRASRLDLAEAWDVTTQALFEIEPDAREGFDEAMGEFRGEMGFDLYDDLVATFGDAWTAYTDPSTGGMFGSGVTLVASTRDADTLEQTLGTITQRINETFEDNGAGFRFRAVERDGYTEHSLFMPFVAPSWAVVDDRLIFSLTAQGVGAAVLHARAPENSFLNQMPEGATAASTKLVGAVDPDPTSMGYVDYAKTAANLYQGYAMGINLLAMQAGGEMPFNPTDLLPPLETITPHLAPGASYDVVDDAGYHRRTISPFPGASVLSPDVVFSSPTLTVLPNLMFLSRAVPPLGQAREQARHTVSMSNLRQLGVAAMAWSIDHDARLPPSLAAVFPHYVENPEVFFAPSDPQAIDDSAGLTADELAKLGSYLYVPTTLTVNEIEWPSEHVLALERPRVWGPGERHAVLFADGHTETRYDAAETQRLIQRQTGRTLAELLNAPPAAATP
ncbi:MAG: hypothetical protein AAF710_02470 [Planctomycetota bacterium]